MRIALISVILGILSLVLLLFLYDAKAEIEILKTENTILTKERNRLAIDRFEVKRILKNDTTNLAQYY